MTFIWQALWYVVAVSLLVTVHEFGHYWVARRLGFKVLRFSVGFGKPLFSRVSGPDNTEYAIAAIPLGGYVRLLDEREGPVPPADLARSFTRKPPWQRIAVLLAGPGFNIVFAIGLLWAMLWYSGIVEYKPRVGEVTPNSIAARGGLVAGDEIVAINGQAVQGQRDVVFDLLNAITSSSDTQLQVRGSDARRRTVTLNVPNSEDRRRLTEPSSGSKGLGLLSGIGFQFWEPSAPAVIREVVPDGPAAKAGLKAGDQFISIDEQPVELRNFVSRVEASVGKTVLVRYKRAGIEEGTRVTVASETADGHTVGRIKATVGPPPGMDIKYPPDMTRHIDLSPGAALARAGDEAWKMVVLQGRLFYRMALGQVSVKILNGPISIAEFAGESADAGVASFLEFLVMISLSLGFLNLLPIPILDGGQIVFQLAEWLKGSPVSERAQAFGQQAGIALLILLMGVALFNDIARQLS
jgi:regulator of sigma E protease